MIMIVHGMRGNTYHGDWRIVANRGDRCRYSTVPKELRDITGTIIKRGKY